MRRGLLCAGLSFCALAVIFLLGPRVEIDDHVAVPTLPPDLDAYLAEMEGRFADLRPGTEKKIVWADSTDRRQAPFAIVYLHGFSASRQEVAPLCDSLAARLGANLFYTRLAGHGRPGAALGEVTVNDWLEDAVEALAIGRRLGQAVLLIGTSTGASLIAWLAATQRMDDVAAIILMSPNFGLNDHRANMLLWPWGRQIAEALIGSERSWAPVSEEQAYFWTTTYPTRALLPMMGLVSLAADASADGISVPALVVYSPRDRVVDSRMTLVQFERLSSPLSRLEVFETRDPSGHVLGGRILSPATTGALLELIESYLERTVAAVEGDVVIAS